MLLTELPNHEVALTIRPLQGSPFAVTFFGAYQAREFGDLERHERYGTREFTLIRHHPFDPVIGAGLVSLAMNTVAFNRYPEIEIRAIDTRGRARALPISFMDLLRRPERANEEYHRRQNGYRDRFHDEAPIKN